MIFKYVHVTFVVIVYLSAFLYVLYRLNKVFPKGKKIIFWGLPLLLSVFFVVVQYLRIRNFGKSFLIFQCVSYLWMTIVFYTFFFILLGDLVVLLLRRIPPICKKFLPFETKTRKCYYLLSVCLSGVLLAYGLVHFTHPKIVHLEIEVDKPVPDWNILLVSDLHIGTMSPKLLQKQVEKMNALQPDLVLMAGDQFELNPKEVEQEGYSEILSSIQAPKGVFVVNGNHEVRHGYLRMQNHAADFYKTMNMGLLSDTAIVLDHQLTLIGRTDTVRGIKRRSLEGIMANTPKDIPNILLDHQPLDLTAAQRCDVDLQLSGHMHNGQLFPINMVQWTKCLFNRKLHHGYRKMANTNYYVTAGLGGSGAPVRIGTTGEIVLIKFKQKTP